MLREPEVHWFKNGNEKVEFRVKRGYTMKIDTVRYMGETSPLELTYGKLYKVLSVECGWYRIIDDTGEDYLYPAGNFEVVN